MESPPIRPAEPTMADSIRSPPDNSTTRETAPEVGKKIVSILSPAENRTCLSVRLTARRRGFIRSRTLEGRYRSRLLRLGIGTDFITGKTAPTRFSLILPTFHKKARPYV